MPQLDYNEMAAAVKGGLADSGFTDKVGGVSAVDIAFGLGVQKLATGLVGLPSAAGQIFGGVAVQNTLGTDRATGLAVYEAEQEITLLKKGRIWVYSEQAVNPTLAVFWRHTTTTTELPGDFRVDIAVANATDISAFAKWVSVTTAAGLAILEVNAP